MTLASKKQRFFQNLFPSLWKWFVRPLLTTILFVCPISLDNSLSAHPLDLFQLPLAGVVELNAVIENDLPEECSNEELCQSKETEFQ